jgi:hypothetical protein
MVIRRRRRAIPADLQHQAPAGAARIQETWPDGAQPGQVDPDRVDWLDADDQPIPLRTAYRQLAVTDLPAKRRKAAPEGAVTAVERYQAYSTEPRPSDPATVTWLDADGKTL